MASPKYPPTVYDVAAALKKRYRDFNHYNLKDLLDELLFIICSTKTGEASYLSTYRLLKETFPTHLRIAEAPAEYIARPIVSGGLSNQKAKAIRSLLDMVVEKFGEPTLEPLRMMSDKEAETFLLSLPGVGKKVARCVLMYSLGRKVFRKRSMNCNLFIAPFRWLNPWHANSTAATLQFLQPSGRMASHA
jgi:endonuclease III